MKLPAFINRFVNGPDSISKKELIKYLPINPVIVEAGICDGSDTEEFAINFPFANIHGFECLPYQFSIARERLSKYPNVTIYPYALNEISGIFDFFVSKIDQKYSASSSLLKPELHEDVHPHVQFDETIKVQCLTLDEWADKHNITRVDFLWLDLQGAELSALRGANQILKQVKVIYTEVSLIETYKGVPLYTEVKDYLNLHGFIVEKKYLNYKDMGNVLFIRK